MTEMTSRVLVNGRWFYEHTCANPDCGKRFTSSRSDARYHHVNCRMKLYRQRLAKSPANS